MCLHKYCTFSTHTYKCVCVLAGTPYMYKFTVRLCTYVLAKIEDCKINVYTEYSTCELRTNCTRITSIGISRKRSASQPLKGLIIKLWCPLPYTFCMLVGYQTMRLGVACFMFHRSPIATQWACWICPEEFCILVLVPIYRYCIPRERSATNISPLSIGIILSSPLS